jgi:hypothetical protein
MHAVCRALPTASSNLARVHCRGAAHQHRRAARAVTAPSNKANKHSGCRLPAECSHVFAGRRSSQCCIREQGELPDASVSFSRKLGGAPDLFHVLFDLLSGLIGHFERHIGYPPAGL